MKKLNKVHMCIISFFQIFFIQGLIQDIIRKGIVGVKEPNHLIVVVIASIIIIGGIYGSIINKFWQIKKYLIYRVFTILNIIFILNMIVNFIRPFTKLKYTFIVGVNMIMLGFLIINLILILTYNRNLRALENKFN